MTFIIVVTNIKGLRHAKVRHLAATGKVRVRRNLFGLGEKVFPRRNIRWPLCLVLAGGSDAVSRARQGAGILREEFFRRKGAAAGNEVKEAVQMAPRLGDQGSFFQLRAQIQQRDAFLFSHRPVYRAYCFSGYGNYSYYKILSENDRGVSVHQTYDAVLEFDYRLQLRTCSRLFSILSALMPPAWWRMPRSWVSRGERRFRSTARRSHRAWASQSLPPSRSARPNAQARRWRARFWCSMENRSSSGCSWRSRQRARKWARERY